MDNKLNVGVIGLGYAGINIHLLNYLNNPNVRVVAIADVDKRKLNYVLSNIGIMTAYEDYKKLLKRDDIDAVSVATPPFLHAEISIEAMENGKDVLCEKPMTVDIKSANLMIKKEGRTGRKLMIGFNQRFLLPYKLIKKMIEEKSIGEIENIREFEFGNYLISKQWEKFKWLKNKNKSPGLSFSEAGSHIIDRFLWITSDRVISVFGYSKKFKGIEDATSVALLKFKSGAIGEIATSYVISGMSWKNKSLSQLKIYGNKQSMELDMGEYYKNKQCMIIREDENVANIPIKLQRKSDYAIEINSFVNSSLRDEKLEITSMDGKKALQILIAFYKSIKKHREIRVSI